MVGCTKQASASAFGVVAALPSRVPAYRDGEEVVRRLTGALIVAIGTPDGGTYEGGGLVIDCVPEGAGKAEGLVLAFNKNGM